MTPIERAEKIAFEYDALSRDNIVAGLQDAATKAAFAARCIRAVIEASKEENWSESIEYVSELHGITYHKEKDRFREGEQENGFEFFLTALTGEQK